MTAQFMLRFIISIFLLSGSVAFAQEEEETAPVEPEIADTLNQKEQYGLRVGIDISKPLRSFLEEDYTGFEIIGDYRIYEDYYLAAEIGNETALVSVTNVTANYKGSYFKVGANYNAYNNWEGMQNSIYVGLRYGFSTFSSELKEYTIYTTNDYFEPDIRTISQEFKNLTASWIEVQLGIKVEVLHNIYLGAHVELKRRISQTQPLNFDNLYIPGFHRTYDGSTWGVGFGYSISYLIPLYKM
ncbi:MAG TPA: DUF6048 family protein [Salinimicrobium sp.]|nr:DUF6048 family protein [Salinimicrobium sp.]